MIIGDFRKEFDAIAVEKRSDGIDRLVVDLKKNTPVKTGEARDGWRREGDSIVNEVKHIEALNGGSSQQAPSHFIESTLLTQEGIIPSGTIVRSTMA